MDIIITMNVFYLNELYILFENIFGFITTGMEWLQLYLEQNGVWWCRWYQNPSTEIMDPRSFNV